MSRSLSVPRPLPLPWPSRANGAILPAACALVLAVAAIGQGFSVDPAPEPPAVLGGGVRERIEAPAIAPGLVPPVLRQTDVFDPARTARPGSGGAATPSGPLGDATLAGSVQFGARAYAILQRADGVPLRLGIGSRYRGLRLIAVDAAGATFQQGAARIHVAYGAGSGPITPADESGNEETN